jgi:hypothetical protein
MNPNLSNLCAGLSDVVVEPKHFELGQGVTISQTYAHLMAPFLMAFAPAPPGKPHPAPWKPAKGGFSIDISAELFVPETCALEHLDRLNTVWWIVALLRIKATAEIFVPIVSTEHFGSIPASAEEPEFWPMEIFTHRLMPLDVPRHRVSVEELEWLKANWHEASVLLANEDFSFAFQAIDQSVFGSNPALALVSVWSALERLFSPSHQELSFRVSANIATYLEPPGRERYKCFLRTKKLYDHRSQAAHGSGAKGIGPYAETYAIARRAILKMVEMRHVPPRRELDAELFGDDIRIAGENTLIQ